MDTGSQGQQLYVLRVAGHEATCKFRNPMENTYGPCDGKTRSDTN